MVIASNFLHGVLVLYESPRCAVAPAARFPAVVFA